MNTDIDEVLAKAKIQCVKPPKPEGPAEKQTAILDRWGWVWTHIPVEYRYAGVPPIDVLTAARECLHPDSHKLRILTLTGPVGVGKTIAAAQLAAWIDSALWAGETRPSEHRVRYHLCLRMGWAGEDEIDESIGCSTLIMDDLSGSISAAGLAKAQQIIEERKAHQRRTIVTTTMTLRTLAAREREVNGGVELGLASRLAGGRVVVMGGPDRRTA